MVVLWPGICSTIVSFRYHFILGVSRFLTVCETSPLSLFFLPSFAFHPKEETRTEALSFFLIHLLLLHFLYPLLSDPTFRKPLSSDTRLSDVFYCYFYFSVSEIRSSFLTEERQERIKLGVRISLAINKQIL